MDRKKIAVSGIAITLMCILVAVVAFQCGVYYREASLNIDVGTYSMHTQIYLQRAGETEITTIKDGVAIDNDGQITGIGLNLTAAQLGGTPSTSAHWISLSMSSDSPSYSWTEIPSEITNASGLARASGAYTFPLSPAIAGKWTISYQFTATATFTDVQLTGLQFAASGDGNLLGADTFTPVTLNSGDKLTVTWTVTVS